jgi:hypothetical protein
VPTSDRLFWEQSERLFARWRRQLDRHPHTVHREITTYLRWLNRLDPQTEEARTIREVLAEMAVELLIEAMLGRPPRG